MISKEELRRMYWDDGMSQSEIAVVVGVSKSRVSCYMRTYEIPSRNRSESKLGNLVKPSEKELRQMYLDKKMSMTIIAKLYHVSQSTIVRSIKKFGIIPRTLSESKLHDSIKPFKSELNQMYHDKEMTQGDIAEVIGVSCVSISRWMHEYGIELRTSSESHSGDLVKPSKEELEGMYLYDGMSSIEISNMIGIPRRTISCWLVDYGIKIRTQSESLTGKFTGESHHNWQNGISSLPYCYKFNDEFKEAVRERDDYTCQLCGHEQNSTRLAIHHIHYDKENCEPDVIALCRSCNAIVNFDRDFWEKYFEDQLEQRGLLNWHIT